MCLQRMRKVRSRFGLKDIVQIHHIIPKQHHYHPSLKHSNFDIDCCRNLMFMPASPLSTTRRNVHNGGHTPYNKYVLSKLDSKSADDLLKELRFMLRTGDPSLPWK